MSAREDFDRAADRAVIWQEAAAISERSLKRAVADAAWLVAPRVRLVDEQRRIVRVVNAPEQARSHPPHRLMYWWDDTLYRRGYDPVGVYRGQSGGRDFDFVAPRTRPADDFLAILRDGLDPTAVIRGGDLRISFNESL